MKKEEAKKLMKNKFIEIGIQEYREIWHIGEIIMHCQDGEICFKPKK